MPGAARRFSILLAAALCAPAAFAQDLNHQDVWSEGDKKAFLNYLKSGKEGAVTGSVKEVPGAAEETVVKVRKARYATLELASDTVFTVAPSGALANQSTSFGPRLLVGGHLFTWIRYYGGVQYNSMTMPQNSGQRALVSHVQIPLGLELALIPLGTPQTRYVLLRGGVTAHHFGSNADSGTFQTPLIGWQGSWNVGLGYEWQVPQTGWRLHLLAEGYKSFLLKDASRFYGVGLTGGVAYTF